MQNRVERDGQTNFIYVASQMEYWVAPSLVQVQGQGLSRVWIRMNIASMPCAVSASRISLQSFSFVLLHSYMLVM